MNTRITILILFFLAGCEGQSEERSADSSMQESTPIINAEEAKAIFERIDPQIKFTLSSNEYLGTTDHLYYADVMKPISQVTINIGKGKDAKTPLHNLYISISAHKPLDEAVRHEISQLVEKYINGFLAEAFPYGKQLVIQCSLPVDSNATPKEFELETDTYYLKCSTSKGDGNPEHFSYVLSIMENAHQEELNQRFMREKRP